MLRIVHFIYFFSPNCENIKTCYIRTLSINPNPKNYKPNQSLILGPNYNKRIRPSYGGKPVLVDLNLSIRAIGPINELKQDYNIDCYFRQSWYDDRLIFNSTGVKSLPLNWQFINKIWKPDTFFVNGKKSKMHKITVPNKFLRISPDGQVSYSQRLTIHARYVHCTLSMEILAFFRTV